MAITDFDQWALPKLGLIRLILCIMGYYRQVRLGEWKMIGILNAGKAL